MKRIVSRTVYKAVPDLSQPPAPTPYALFVRLFGYPPAAHATFGWDYTEAKGGGYVPVNFVPEQQDVAEEYLSVGELREALADIPDDTPIYIGDEYEGSQAERVKYDGKTLDIE